MLNREGRGSRRLSWSSLEGLLISSITNKVNTPSKEVKTRVHPEFLEWSTRRVHLHHTGLPDDKWSDRTMEKISSVRSRYGPEVKGRTLNLGATSLKRSPCVTDVPTQKVFSVEGPVSASL